MPYFREYFVNSWVPSKLGSLNTVTVTDSADITSWRSNPHPEAIESIELLDKAVDPYAYFLMNSSEREYRARLRERNLPVEGRPDRGRAFSLYRHRLLSKPLSATALQNGKPLDIVNTVPYSVQQWQSTFAQGSPASPRSYAEDKSALDKFGQTAYLKMAPTGVVFDAATFLGELREGLPKLSSSLLMSETRRLKGAGSDYLNVQFGWKPFIADIQNAARALMGATQMLTHKGQRVHRRLELPIDSRFETFSGSASLRLSAGAFGVVPVSVMTAVTGYRNTSTIAVLAANVDYVAQHTVRIRRWFEGEFTSFLPLNFDPNSYLDRARVLINLKMTPSTLWELAPWSWLVDWFFHIQDTIAANQLVANDRLIMHYGYAMEHLQYIDDFSWTGLRDTGSKPSSNLRHGDAIGVSEWKRRIRANPYGFKATAPGALNASQLAVLGALGLTKLG